MGFFSGLILFQAVILLIVFAFVFGVVVGAVGLACEMEEMCPDAYLALKADLELKRKEKRETVDE